jgi:hypothetical protein
METVEQLRRPVTDAQRRARTPARCNVDIKDRDDMMMWCRRLGVTPFQLCSLVDRVGSEAASIELALRAR